MACDGLGWVRVERCEFGSGSDRLGRISKGGNGWDRIRADLIGMDRNGMDWIGMDWNGLR